MESNSLEQHTSHDRRHQPSNSELLSDAKLLAEAAKAGLNHETDKIDKGKAAGAAADLIDAASHYGKLEEKGVGKYMEKGEQYLNQYHSSHSSTTTHSTETGQSTSNTTTTSHSYSSGGGEGGGGHSESGGYGDYINMAQGLFKKH